MKKSVDNDPNFHLKKNFENPYLFFMNLINKKQKKRNLSTSNYKSPGNSINKSKNEKEILSCRNKRLSNPDIFKGIVNGKSWNEIVKKTPSANTSHIKSNSTIPSLALPKKKLDIQKPIKDLKINLKSVNQKQIFKANDYFVFDKSVFTSRKSSLPTNQNKSVSRDSNQKQPLSHRRPVKPQVNPLKINIVNANNYLLINNENVKTKLSPKKPEIKITEREIKKSIDIRRIEAKTNSMLDLYNDPTEEISITSSKFKCSYRTRAGNLTSRSEVANQDSILIMKCLSGNSNTHMFAAADGHGKYGQIVSNFVLYHLSDFLSCDPELIEEPERALGRSFFLVNKKLSGSSIDTSLSGSTALVVLMTEEKILCANVGDTRAIIAKSWGKSMEVMPLSVDHKPTIREESLRVSLMGGRIEPMKDEKGKNIGPPRIWLQDENFPGITLSRSIGDLIASQIGVISEPECDINEENLNFIIIGTDGVWNYMTNEEVANIVDPFSIQNDIEGACDALMNECNKRWSKHNEHVIDDISFIIIFFRK